MLKFKENALEGVLYYLHRQGQTPQAAHAELLSITGEETMSQEDVVDFFGKIHYGTYGIKRIDEDSKLHLTKQVDEVYDKIVESLDLSGRLSLLTTCKQLREESRTREFHIKTLTINFSSTYFQFNTDDGYDKTILLMKHTKHTNDPDGDEERSYSSFMDEIKCELKKVFQFKSTRIDSLNLMMEDIDRRPMRNQTIYDVFDVMHAIVSSRKVKFTSVKTNCPSDRFCSKVLRFVQGLKHVKFVEQQQQGFMNRFDTIYGVEDVEKFTSAQKMKTIAWGLAHIPYCKICVGEAPTVEVLMELKEKLLLNPKLQQLKIRSKPSLKIYKKLNEHFKTYIMPRAKIPIIQTFNYPGSPTDKLTFYATDQLFWFKGPCFKDDGEPDEEPEGANNGFERRRGRRFFDSGSSSDTTSDTEDDSD